MLENEQVQSDAEVEVSSEPQSEPAKAAEASEPRAETPTKSDTTEEHTPFHKDPKVQDYLERQIAKRTETYEQRLSQQQQQFQEFQRRFQEAQQPKEPDKRAAMLERLKGIDPEFAEFVSGLAPSKELEDLRTWRAQQEQQSVRAQYDAQLNQLHTQHKVDDFSKARYAEAIQAKIRANPQLRLQDLPQIYKEVHDAHSQWIEGIRRAEREAYVKLKKEAATAPPSQPRGSNVAPSKSKTEWAKDPGMARQQLIDKVVQKARANSDI